MPLPDTGAKDGPREPWTAERNGKRRFCASRVGQGRVSWTGRRKGETAGARIHEPSPGFCRWSLGGCEAHVLGSKLPEGFYAQATEVPLRGVLRLQPILRGRGLRRVRQAPWHGPVLLRVERRWRGRPCPARGDGRGDRPGALAEVRPGSWASAWPSRPGGPWDPPGSAWAGDGTTTSDLEIRVPSPAPHRSSPWKSAYRQKPAPVSGIFPGRLLGFCISAKGQAPFRKSGIFFLGTGLAICR